MCRCLQGCWESFWWNCIEEKFCYDESIAKYNPDENDYQTKAPINGLSETHNNNAPVCRQPGALLRHQSCASSKIHEEDCREIQLNGPILAPEILAVFANSQIFHDHQAKTKQTRQLSPSAGPAETVHQFNKRENDSEKLLKRLEDQRPSSQMPSETQDVHKKIKFTVSGVDDDDDEDDDILYTHENPDHQPPHRSASGHSSETVSSTGDNELILRAKPLANVDLGASQLAPPVPIMNKQLRNVKSMPQFNTSHLPNASLSNIFVINDDAWNRFSMTPEIPSISFTTLPKNYEDTPQVEKYQESLSLYSIQTANTARVTDYTMPRYYGKGDMFAHSVDNLSSVVAQHDNTEPTLVPKKRIDMSKRLKKLRGDLPPLMIAATHSKDKLHR